MEEEIVLQRLEDRQGTEDVYVKIGDKTEIATPELLVQYIGPEGYPLTIEGIRRLEPLSVMYVKPNEVFYLGWVGWMGQLLKQMLRLVDLELIEVERKRKRTLEILMNKRGGLSSFPCFDFKTHRSNKS